MLRKRLTDQIYGALENVIVKGTGRLPFVTPDADEIVARVNTLTHQRLSLRVPGDFFDPRIPVEALDWAANEYTRRAQLVAVTSGAGTSTIGLMGVAVDVPILVATTVGLVRRHALVYGFTELEDSRGDAVPLLMALGAAFGAEITIGQLTPRFARWASVDVGTRLIERYLLTRISERVANELIVHWLPRAVPIVGAAAAAALDYAFLRVAGRRSQQHYRGRHVRVRAQLAGGDEAVWQQLRQAHAQRRRPAASEIDDDIIDGEFELKRD